MNKLEYTSEMKRLDKIVDTSRDFDEDIFLVESLFKSLLNQALSLGFGESDAFFSMSTDHDGIILVELYESKDQFDRLYTDDSFDEWQTKDTTKEMWYFFRFETLIDYINRRI